MHNKVTSNDGGKWRNKTHSHEEVLWRCRQQHTQLVITTAHEQSLTKNATIEFDWNPHTGISNTMHYIFTKLSTIQDFIILFSFGSKQTSHLQKTGNEMKQPRKQQ
jgi:hypothetical protein